MSQSWERVSLASSEALYRCWPFQGPRTALNSAPQSASGMKDCLEVAQKAFKRLKKPQSRAVPVPCLLKAFLERIDMQAIVTPEISPKVVSEAATGMKERLEAAQKEIERLKRSLEEGTAQQEWMLSNVVKSTAAEKEELTTALQ